jgi:hypothetical protein
MALGHMSGGVLGLRACVVSLDQPYTPTNPQTDVALYHDTILPGWAQQGGTGCLCGWGGGLIFDYT